LDRDPLIAFLVGSELRTKSTDAERSVALLGWVAESQPVRFRDYIQSLTTGRRYLGLNREEIITQCHHNEARPIPGTTFWAIINLDTPTKRRFLRRVLTFCGYRSEVVDFAVQVFGRRRVALAEETAAT
jgi:negative modulator of initiation of replication